ncbi:IS630 family transposase [Ancylothrix sp. C2]|uniref:IS630 family transposase n=1 Tax=Ancylothrix sp. D3o TaxID=2953691 RepID=UPI0021BB1731|nr:IS630 family transposase [Ancylothrix sp. D3o]MCT7953047.1 IS630 family transposase [Ancylothrix sp. D3o]
MEDLELKRVIKELDELIKSNPDSRELKRALAVKLALQGWKYSMIATTLNVSKSFITKWQKKIKSAGIEGIKLSYKGSQSYLSREEKQAVIAWLQKQEHWDLSELECYLIEQYDVVFQSPTSYYRLLAEAKISCCKAQKKNGSKDPEVVKKKNQEIQFILEKLMPKIKSGEVTVYAVDEVHLLEGDLISHLWGDSQERLKIPIINEKNRQTSYGALDLINQELIVRAYQAGNSDSTVDFIQELIKLNPEKQIIIFWDGAAYHRSELIRCLLETINQDLPPQKWKVTCYLFAPYAPENNPIESVWLSLKSLLRRCYRFCKNFTIMKRLFKLLVDLKLFSFPNIKNYDAFSCLI